MAADDDTLLPENRTAWETAESETSARLLALDTEAIRRERRPDQCAAAWLPFLGWERSVHFWRDGDDAGNRARTASSFDDHLLYGAPATLEAEIAQDLAYPVTLREFFEVPGAEWPDFFVDVDLDPSRPDLWPSYEAALISATRRKNVRDWPTVRMVVPSSGPAFLGAAGMIGGVITSTPLDLTPRSSVTEWVGAAGAISGIITSRPYTA